VHLDELSEEELDPVVLGALADLVVRHGLPSVDAGSRRRAYLLVEVVNVTCDTRGPFVVLIRGRSRANVRNDTRARHALP
jgi:hypothetical protein